MTLSEDEKARVDEIDNCIADVYNALDAEKMGEWIEDEGVHRCSECRAVLEGDDWTWRNNYYCYHCGAKMKRWDE